MDKSALVSALSALVQEMADPSHWGFHANYWRNKLFAILAERGEVGPVTHDWYRPRQFAYLICRICGVVQRTDGKNKPCKGPTRLRQMEGETPSQETPMAGSEACKVTADGSEPADAHTAPPVEAQQHQDIEPLRRALGNCYMMAKREIARILNGKSQTDAVSLERWRHVQRFCEETGLKSSILRATLPTELTEGSEPLPLAHPIFLAEHTTTEPK